MANRPRRPKPGARPETTIDLDAERIAAPTNTDVAGSGGEDTVEGASRRDEDEVVSTPAPTAAEAHEEALLSATAEPPEERDRKNEIATGSASADALALGESHSTAESSVRDDDRMAGATGASVSSDAASPVATETQGELAGVSEPAGAEIREDGSSSVSGAAADFARDEGFTDPHRPRRDLGEFEDDETVLPESHPQPAEPDPLATSPYHAAAGTTHSNPQGQGFGPLLGAGLLGAALALGGGAALLYSGVLPPPGGRAEPVQTQQFATAGEVQQITGDVSNLRTTVEQLQSAQAAGGAGSGNVSQTDFTQLADRVTANERAVQSGGASTGDAAAAAAGASETANAAREAADAATNTANQARDTASAAQGTAQSAQEAASSAQQAAQNAQTAANESREAVDGFASRLASIEEANRRAAVALSAASLKAAIDSGRPFMGELETYAGAVGGNEQSVEALRGFAASGVPTGASLQSGWNEAEGSILNALRPNDPTADVGTQVLSGLRSLVTVRPTGTGDSVNAPGPEATVARMDNAISSEDFAGWLREWDSLPEAAKSQTQGFADQVRARANADDIIRQTINSAVGASASQG